MFKVKAKLNGEEVELKWDKGRLTGDSLAVITIESEARIAEGEEIGPPHRTLPRRFGTREKKGGKRK